MLQLFKSTSMFMFHHQSQKRLSFNVQSQLPLLKSTTKSSSLRLHLHHNTKPQSSQSNHKTKKRPSSMFWSRNQKPHKTSSSQLFSQHNPANQKSTSSSTRPKRKLAVPSVEVTQAEIQAPSVEVTQAELAVEISDHQSVMTSHTVAILVFLLAVSLNLNTDHQANKQFPIKKRF